MPITKSAIKQMKQNRVKYARNRNYSSRMKSMVKLILDYVQKGELDKANKILPKVVSAIDVAAKKNLIHQNNAARKKSRIQKALSANVKVKDVKAKAEKQTKETNK
jgi:small subunit ribosomal protein S20